MDFYGGVWSNSFSLFCSSQTANAVDQAALVALWNGFTSKGTLGWNTTRSLCGQTGWLALPLEKSIFCEGKTTTSTYCSDNGSIVIHLIPVHLSGLSRLDNMGMAGTVATEIGILTSLTWLWVNSASCRSVASCLWALTLLVSSVLQVLESEQLEWNHSHWDWDAYGFTVSVSFAPLSTWEVSVAIYFFAVGDFRGTAWVEMFPPRLGGSQLWQYCEWMRFLSSLGVTGNLLFFLLQIFEF